MFSVVTVDSLIVNMPIFRPKRTTELILEELENGNNEKPSKENASEIVESISRLKFYDSTPITTNQSSRRVSSTLSKWAPKRTQELQVVQSDSGDETNDNQKTTEELSEPSEPSESSSTAQDDVEERTPDNLPPPPRFMHRSSMTKLKLRGREVLGLISNNNKVGDSKDLPGIFKNIKSPDMRASMDVSRLSDIMSSSEVTSKESSINLNTQPQTKSLSSSLLQLKEVLHSEKRDIEPFTLDVLNREYFIKSVLGKGGTGTVFVGVTNDNEELAIKITELNGDEDRISGFYREASLMRKLKGNKHVIQIVDE